MSDYNSKLPVRNQGIYNALDNEDASNVALVSHERSATPGQDTQTQRNTSILSTDGRNVTALDCAISDSEGNAITEQNPLPVFISRNPGIEVIVPNESVDVAKDATANVDYTVTAAMTLKDITFDGSASGKARFSVLKETGVGAGTYTRIDTKFNSTAFPNVKFELPKLEVEAGVKIRIAVTNLDSQAQSIYTLLQGIEVG